MLNLTSIDKSILAIKELFPPEKSPTKFDKGVDLIKALSCTTIPGAIGQVLESGIKTFQTLYSERNRIECVKYVSDMYEVQQKSQAEMRKLELQSKSQFEQNRNVTIYIEKSFQSKIDEITKDHLYRMRKIDNNKNIIIYAIDSYAKMRLHEIDKEYAAIIRKNEAMCLLYRQTLQDMYEKNVTPTDLLVAASQRYFSIAEQAFSRSNGNSQSTQAVLNSLMEFIKYMGDPNRFITFQDFLERKKVLEVD